MPNELLPVRILMTKEFLRSLKSLKKYRSIKKDVHDFRDSIRTDDFPGDRLQDVEGIVYKARIANSDNNKGKSGGYRIIYAYEAEIDLIILVDIYSKSDQPNISPKRIAQILQDFNKDTKQGAQYVTGEEEAE